MSDYLVDRKAEDGEDFTSSNVDILGYDRASETLYVEFHSSPNVYAYEGVKESTFDMLVNADSVGSFYARHIKGTYDGELVGDGVIELREDAEEEVVPSGYAIGDRVMIHFDDKCDWSQGPVWNGPGTVERVYDDGCVVVRTDNDHRERANDTGGFYDNDLSRLEDGGEQGDTKWASVPEGETPDFAQGGLVAAPGEIRLPGGVIFSGTLTTPVIQPTRYSIEYTVEHGTSGRYKPEFQAMSEADALAQFNEALNGLTTVLGWNDVKVKIVSVTHYLD